VELKESQRVELKESLSQLDDALKSVCAFLNHKGGIVYFGVNDKGIIIGLDVSDKTLRKISQQIISRIKPEIAPEIKEAEEMGKSIIQVKVPEGSNKPYFLNGIAYKKIGTEKRAIPPDELKRIILEQKQIRWDEELCKEARLEDINWNFVKDFFIKKYESVNKTNISSNPKSLLESLDCIKNNKPTNAGILLFGKNPQRFFPNSYIAIVRYKSKEIGTKRLDYKEFNDNLFEQIDKADEYIKEHIAIMSKLIPGKIEREDIPEYPFFVIRELIVNTVAHRSYEEQRSKIIISMFDDKIKYYNPGGLPEGITPKNIVKKQKSVNPIIARVLSKVRYIEELGEGWDRIVNEFKKYPFQPRRIIIKDFKDAVLVTVYKTVLDVLVRFKSILNNRQIKVLDYLKSKEIITTSEYSEMFGVTDRQARVDLAKLISLNLIKREGKARLIRYRLYPEVSGSIRKTSEK